MKTCKLLSSISLTAFYLIGCGCGGPQGQSAVDPTLEAPIVTEETTVDEPSNAQADPDPDQIPAGIAPATNAFAADLFAKLRETDGNFAFSPASISLALAMTHAGARGETAEQMAATLHLSGLSDEEIKNGYRALLASWNDDERTAYELRVANRLFGEQTVDWQAPFVSATGEYFGAPLESVDFRSAAEPSRQHINSWVASQTNDLILDLIPGGAIDNDTRMVLTNAIYFKGSWETPFNEERTRNDPFYRTGSAMVSVPTMRQTHRFPFAQTEELSVLRMNYLGDEMEMVLLLPTERGALAQLESHLTASKLEELISSTQETEVDVSLPRFRIEQPQALALSPALQQLGMALPFNQDEADFSGMSDFSENEANRLAISEVFHKAFVEVNEEGTEAAAATAVVMATRGMAPQNPSFRAEHPFLFLIRDTRSGTIMFMGRVADPS